MEAKGFAYSYDMLGEAATTAADARRYYADYEKAIHAIGKRSINANLNFIITDRPPSAAHPAA